MTYKVNTEREIKEIFNKKLEPGDVIEIWGKEYNFNTPLSFSSSGTPDNHITIKGSSYFYINASFSFARIKRTDDKINGVVLNGDYIDFENINISNATHAGLVINGNHNYIKNVDCSYNLDSGIKVRGCQNILEKCSASHNFDPDFCKIVKDKTIEMPGFNSDGISDKLHDGPGNTFIECYSYHNGDDGFDFFLRNTPEDQPTKMIRCVATCNGPRLFDVHKSARYGGRHEFSTEKHPGYSSCKGNGNGFKLGGKRKDTDTCKHNVELEECIAIGNFKYGFFDNHNNGKISLKNCNAIFNGDKNYTFNYSTYDSLGLNIKDCNSLPSESLTVIKTRTSEVNIEDSNIPCNEYLYGRIINYHNGEFIRSCINCKYLDYKNGNICIQSNEPINFKVIKNKISIMYEKKCKCYERDHNKESVKEKEKLYINTLITNANGKGID